MEEEESSLGSPPGLVESLGDSEDSQGRRAELEELEEPTSSGSPSVPTFSPVLSISLSSLSERQQGSSLPWPMSATQVKSPLPINSPRDQSATAMSTTVVTLAPQVTQPAATDGDEHPVSKLSSLPLDSSEPPVTSESPIDDNTVTANGTSTQLIVANGGEVPAALGDGEKQPGLRVQQQKPVSDTGTEDDDDDVIEIEDDSELDTSVGGAEKEEEKGNSASADTPSSDDEWDESLLPPRFVIFNAEYPFSEVPL